MATRDQLTEDLPSTDCQKILGMEGIEQCVHLETKSNQLGGLELTMKFKCGKGENIGVECGGSCPWKNMRKVGGKENQ